MRPMDGLPTLYIVLETAESLTVSTPAKLAFHFLSIRSVRIPPNRVGNDFQKNTMIWQSNDLAAEFLPFRPNGCGQEMYPFRQNWRAHDLRRPTTSSF